VQVAHNAEGEPLHEDPHMGIDVPPAQVHPDVHGTQDGPDRNWPVGHDETGLQTGIAVPPAHVHPLPHGAQEKPPNK